jgi:hypothetical protein
MSKKSKSERRTCNQCMKNMEHKLFLIDSSGEMCRFGVPFCTNPACLNYALLQVSLEQMPKESK